MHITAFVICHKLERYVDRALASLAVQTRLPDRIVAVGTDCRTETADALRRWSDRGVEVVFSPKPLKCWESKNFCGDCAINLRTSAIRVEDRAFFTLDADDWVFPRFVELAAGYMEVSGCDVVGCDYCTLFADGRLLPAGANRTPIDDIAKANPLPCCSLIRASAFHKAGGYEPLLFEDWGLWLKLHALGARLFRYPLPLFCYVRHDSNITNTVRFDEALGQIHALCDRLRYCRLPDSTGVQA